MKIAIGGLVLIVVLVGLIFALPFLVDLNKYQDQYKPLIEEALNRKVQLQDIRLTIWPRIGARVAGFAVLDDPAFGSGPFASLSSLDVGVKLMPLLSGKVEVEEVTLREPVITVIKNKNGVLNASTIGRKGTAMPETPSRAPIPSTEGPLKILALLAVDQVSIAGGKLTYRDHVGGDAVRGGGGPAGSAGAGAAGRARGLRSGCLERQGSRARAVRESWPNETWGSGVLGPGNALEFRCKFRPGCCDPGFEGHHTRFPGGREKWPGQA